jgi:hypothetical protein
MITKVKYMNKNYRQIILSTLLIAQPISSFGADTNNMFGVWGSITLQGNFNAISPKFEKFNWLVMNQTRTRDDSPQGSRFTENLLFSQIGYQLNEHSSIALGYLHGWGEPLDKPSFQENRAYQDFIWKQSVGDFRFISRTRMDERFLMGSNEAGYRPRQLLMLKHPLSFIDGLSAYVGDEVLFYLTKNVFGKQGFSENRIFTGLTYQLSQHVKMDMGYMGQYVDTKSDSNLFTHNLQANIGFKF